jgi:hypothetical protein
LSNAMSSLEALFQRDYDLNEPEVCARLMLRRNLEPCSLKRECSTRRIEEHVRGRNPLLLALFRSWGGGIREDPTDFPAHLHLRRNTEEVCPGGPLETCPCLAKAPRDVL